jgi:hypothetical protein
MLLLLASTFHKATILLFGYFIPALSSVKGELEFVVDHPWTRTAPFITLLTAIVNFICFFFADSPKNSRNS